MADFNRLITAGDVVNRTLASMGLPKYVSPSQSTDATARQMWALLTECGQDLLDAHQWRQFKKTYEFTTLPGEVNYQLPSDFHYFVDETGWNNTARIRLSGPLNSQQWRLLQARQLGGTLININYILEGGNIVLYAAPSPEQTLALSYQSRGWVQDQTNLTVYRDFVENDSDLVLFDPRLMISYLKFKWRDAKGFDSTSAGAEFLGRLNAAKYNDAPKRDLNLAGRVSIPLIGVANISDTGYGS